MWQVRSTVKIMLTVFHGHQVWLIMSTLLMVKLATKSTACKFSVIYVMQRVARDWNCGSEATGSSTTIRVLLIHYI